MSLYKMGISDKTMGAAQDSDPEVQKMMLDAQQNNNQTISEPVNKPGFFERLLNYAFGAGASEPNMNAITGEPININTKFYPGTTVPIAMPFSSGMQSDFPFKSVEELPKSITYGSADDVYPEAIKGGITQSTVGQTFEPPFVMAGGQKFALGDPRIAEQKNYFTRPTGIMTQAKDFFTQTVPKIASSAIDFIPGMRFIKSLDKFNTLPYQDRKFIESRMTGTTPGFYVDPNTGALKDLTGKNVRSIFGNYSETVDKEYDRYEKAIKRAEKKYGVTWDGSKFIGTNADTANQMNKFNINAFNFYKQQKDDKQVQQRKLLDKIAAQVKSGETAQIGQSLHGGPTKSGDGGSRPQFTGDPRGAFAGIDTSGKDYGPFSK